jgi:DNA-binding transcriptional LysR family regulator
MTETDWDLYRSFLGVLREGSLSAAARALGQTQPTIGRHIAELEARLGDIALFTRSPRGLLPTETALELRPHAEAMASAAAALARAASGGREAVAGAIRITASEVVGAEVLPPILATFREDQPAIAVEMVLSNRTQDILQRDADIAVRMVRPTQGGLVARSIGEIALGLHAHPSYVAANGLPDSVAALADHALIGYDRETPSIRALRALGLQLTREMFAYRSDSDLAQLAATRAGFGIGICQNGIARRDGLVPVLPGTIRFNLPVWLAAHKDIRTSLRMRLMLDHLAESLARYVRSSGPYPATRRARAARLAPKPRPNR